MDQKDVEQLKKEAAAKAKAAALAKKKAKEAASKEEDSASTEAEPLDIAKQKAAAAAKAKAAALAKKKAKEAASKEENPASTEAEPLDIAKQKAAAAAKAKAAALAKKEAKEAASKEEDPASTKTDPLDIAKAKAAAAAKAKAAAAAKAKQSGAGDLEKEKAKAIAAAKAKAAAAAKAKMKSGGGAKAESQTEPEDIKPSPNQPILEKYIKIIESHFGSEMLEASYINRLSKDVPTIVAKPETYYKLAEFFKYNEQLGFDFLSELHGTDFQTHMEIYTHLYSYKNKQSVALKVKIDREDPVIDSIAPLWAGANWPECEAYDLLGIRFKGHPNLHRIMLGEDWVGYPLRKDYEPYDVEV
ncbi:NADH-quinone oxidoreductase subunit C [Cytobacillus horneckiae]|uniref:NADH-quinone oxidoreductase subunit C n=1 Tax=Cytobacillus horneckiae TaxID=549687 RepID=A0A2N0ZFY0_9BACI|nr:NADH-quinone oxidoreductase subunit C [Cytobacillus horneckiae]MEC1154422.1 NADH-quinone oxidoreductase subunit C [Cytobacillus horneckiae]MED2937757.1 NADH-quinone oxidoreductase subunit C [Cytobacillus horneckiae]PKG28405.1 NADH-quinone oxidoreductase subunit C [Cytobacillus horneckiae]